MILKTIKKKISEKLQTKLLVSFTGIGIFALLLVSSYSFHLAKEALMSRSFEQLKTLRKAKRGNIEEVIKNKLDGVELASTSFAMNQVMTELEENLKLEVNRIPINTFMTGGEYQSIGVIFDTTHYAYGHFNNLIQFTDQVPLIIHTHFVQIYNTVSKTKQSTVFDYLNYHDTLLLTMAAPAFNEDGTIRAVITLSIRLETIDKIMISGNNIDGLGTTGETYLVGKDSYLRSTSKFHPNSTMKIRVNTKAAELALKGQENILITQDYRNKPVLSSFSPINLPGLDWIIISEIDESEILTPIHALQKRVLLACGFVLLLFIMIVIWNSRQLSKPLVKLRTMAIEIADGDYGNTIPVATNDEVGQLTEAFNNMSQEIHYQRQQLEEKNREILASITYAKRIQSGMLPSQRLIEHLLNESFVFYMPKHIVSGDFYYAGSEKGQIILAVGDCTGHGVPGALVSGICMSALQRTIKGFGKTKPSEILDKLNEIVDEMFSASEMDIRDGMDIAICSIDLQGKTLQFAGANNPLYYVRNNEVHVIKADRQSIGMHTAPKPFNNHELSICDDDSIYILSDGYVDQFGGPDGQKYMRSRLKQLLLDINKKPMPTQKFLMEDAIQTWKGSEDQIDDICVFGARL